MKEIHAYLNDDGTYRVEVLGIKFTEKISGKSRIRETMESKMEIPRAKISITGLKSSGEDDDKYFTIMIGDNFDYKEENKC